MATRSEPALRGVPGLRRTEQVGTERAHHCHTPLPWTLTTFIASEPGTCTRFCWWKLAERACDSSVLESWSCWTGANAGCWPYASVTVKPGTNQKKHRLGKKYYSQAKKTPKKLLLQIKTATFCGGLALASRLQEHLLAGRSPCPALTPAGHRLTDEPSTWQPHRPDLHPVTVSRPQTTCRMVINGAFQTP